MNNINRREAMKSYILAANLLSERLWRAAFAISEDMRLSAEEFRLRIGKPFSISVSGKQRDVTQSGEKVTVTRDDIEAVIAKGTQLSFHSFEDQVRRGYITVEGGHRIGLCGRLTRAQNGDVVTDMTSLNIRIAKQMCGIAEGLDAYLKGRPFENTLVISPPGVGKTTLLRDMSRLLSKRHSVSVADCRYELGGSLSGKSAFDLGRCDIMQGGGKAQAVEMLLRSMTPEVIVVDEITAGEDVEAMLEASYTGCGFLASAHGTGPEDMIKRPLYAGLLENGLFPRCIVLERCGDIRLCRIFERSEDNGKAYWKCDDNIFVLGDGDILGQEYAAASADAEGSRGGASDNKDRDTV